LGLVLGLIFLLVGIVGFYWLGAEPDLYPAGSDQGVEVQIVDNGFHTDLVLPRAAVAERSGPLGQAVREQPWGEWIYLGWGDARFFIEEGPVKARWRDGLRALLAWDNASVLMVKPGAAPERFYRKDDRVSLRISAAGYERMVRVIEAGMVTTPENGAVLAKARARDGTRFYAHQERFWIGRLCNHWTIEALSAAGLEVWPWRVMTAGEVMRVARRAEARTARSQGVDLSAQAH